MISKALPFARRIQNRPRRAQGRLSLECPAEFRTRFSVCAARGLDLSEDGIRILAPVSAGVGARVSITLSFPKSASKYSFAAEVCWVDPAGSLDSYWIGARFAHTAQTRTLIRHLLWKLAMEDGLAA